MKPARFDYHAPASVEGLCALLGEHAPDAAVLAGGQSLLLLMNARLARPKVVVDLRRVPGLDGLTVVDGTLEIGARVVQRDLESGLAAAVLPVLPQTLAAIGNAATRNRGTLGGSIALADPTAELPTLLLGLGGSVALRSATGERTVAAEDYFVAGGSVRRPDELLTAVRLHLPSAGARAGFAQVTRRRKAKLSAVVVAAPGGEVRVAIAGVGDRPLLHTGDAALLGDDGLVALADELEPQTVDVGDIHGPPSYRRRLVLPVLRRAVAALRPVPEVAA